MTPLFSHPTKVVLLDDDISFLQNLSLTLPEESFSYKLFQSPREASNYVNNAVPDFESKNFLIEKEDEELNTCALGYDIPSIHNIFKDNGRFEKVSTLIVDYDMPEMNGVEFLKTIKNQNIRKILLTGKANEEIAVDAFNQGVIHKYIKKSRIDEFLNDTIIQSQKDYFTAVSEPVINTLIKKLGSDTALADSAFKDYYHAICERNNIAETYLLDPIGSYLMFNKEGRAFILHTQNKDLADSYYFDVEAEEQEVFSEEEKRAIRTKQKIFCYRSLKNEKLPDASSWGPYFKEAVYIEGENSFYCSFQRLDRSLLSPDTLVAFSQYLRPLN